MYPESLHESHLIQVFLKEGTEDYIGLWSFFKELEIQFELEEYSQVKLIVLKTVKKLLLQDAIRAGEIKNGKFQKWELNGVHSFQKIESSLAQLNRAPNINEICCFETTEIGKWKSKKRENKKKN